MKKTIISLCLFLCSLGLNARVISFSELENVLKTDNDSLQAKVSQAQAIREKLGHKNRSFIPNIQLQVGQESYEGEFDQQSKYFAGVEAELNLFRGGRDSLKELETQETLSKAETQIAKHKLVLLYHTHSIYREIQGLLEKQELNQRYIKELRKIENASNKRVKSRVAQSSETLRIKYEILKAQGHTKEMKLSIDELKTELAVLLGMKEHKDMVFDKIIPTPKNEWTAIDENYSHHPELKIIENDKELVKNQVKQKAGWRLAELSLYSHYGRPALSREEELANLEKNEFALGVRLSIPFNELFTLQVDRKAHQQELTSLEYERKYALNEKQALDHEIRHDLSVTNELWQQNKQEKSLAREIFQAAFRAYEKGAQSTSEIQEALELLVNAEKREVDLLVEYSTKLARLQYLNPLP